MRTLTGNFRSTNISYTEASNLEDWGGSRGYTQGAYLIDTLDVQPTITNPWQIFGYSITYRGWIYYTNPPHSGLLGKLYGGLVRGSQETLTPLGRGISLPWQFGTVFPPDTDLITELWDGSQDNLWASTIGGTTPQGVPAQPQTLAVQLPQPILLTVGDSLSIGLWLTRSLLDNGSLNLGVGFAQYSLIYETMAETPGGLQVPGINQ